MRPVQSCFIFLTSCSGAMELFLFEQVPFSARGRTITYTCMQVMWYTALTMESHCSANQQVAVTHHVLQCLCKGRLDSEYKYLIENEMHSRCQTQKGAAGCKVLRTSKLSECITIVHTQTFSSSDPLTPLVVCWKSDQQWREQSLKYQQCIIPLTFSYLRYCILFFSF